MKVVLSPENNLIINKLYTAAHTCYSNEDPDIIFEKSLSMTKEEMLKTIKHCINSRHLSVIEHQHLTFYISGVSRALSHQLVRHRLADYSQQSQRYCSISSSGFDYITPPTINNNEKAKEEYDKCMLEISECYNKLKHYGIPNEDARFVLPNATTTNITVTMNLRQLSHFMSERLCTTAQWEIRHMAEMIKGEVVKLLPFMKPYLQPKCEQLGYCPESSKRCCGRKPTKEKVLV